MAQCIGPQFESPSEIDALVRLGADVVGMTLGPESRLIAETESLMWLYLALPIGPREEPQATHLPKSIIMLLMPRLRNCVPE